MSYLSPYAIAITLALTGCNEKAPSQDGKRKLYETDKFKSYWYSGEAEINVYDLSQSRYGENREGKAVLIFVTEDFSKKKQVKLDDPSAAGNDKVSVLKLNFTKNFITGIYPYSMMQSLFTPINRNQYSNTLKTTMSSQEWCGQVFTQVNQRGNTFNVKSYSYFEQEGDTEFSIQKVMLEDEIWNLIRLDHTSLPTGEVEIIPSLFFTRLKHEDLKPSKARANKTASHSGFIYSIVYESRKLTIEFENQFPFKIIRWEEEFTERDKVQRTTATLERTLNIDYWTKNRNEFQYLRDSLGLSRHY